MRDQDKTREELLYEIEELRQELSEARQSRRILQSLMRYIPEGVTIADAPDATIRMVSKYGQELTGRKADAIEGISSESHVERWGIFRTDGITPAAARELPLTRATTKGEVVLDEEWVIERPDGTKVRILCNAGPVLDEDGAISGGIIAWRDITERVEAARRIERIARFPDENPNPVLRVSEDGRLLYANGSSRLLLQSLGWEQSSLLPGDWPKTVLDVLESGRQRELEVECDGTIYSMVFAPIVNSGYVNIYGSDITSRKRAEEARRESEEFNRRIIESSFDCIKVLDIEGNLLSISLSGQRLLEIEDVSAYLNTPYVELWDETARPMAVKAIASALQEGMGQFQAFCPSAKGRPMWWDVVVTPIRDAQGNPERLLAVSRDITESKRMEEELLRSRDELDRRVRERTAELAGVNEELLMEVKERKLAEEALKVERQRLFDVLETLPALICLLTPDYHVAFANRSFREKFGESRGRHCYEYCFGLSEPCEFCETYNVLKTGQPHHWEVTIPDGTVVDVHDFPFQDADGSPMILKMDMDITGFRNAEAKLKEAMAKIEESNRALDDFASIASHDMQEPLRKIISFGDQVKVTCGESLDETGCDYLDRIQKAAKRMQILLQALLDYSRVSSKTEPFRPVDLNELVRDVVDDLEVRITETAGTVEVGILPTLPAEPHQMRQLFQNLIGNALKFHRVGEKPMVRVCSQPTDTGQSFEIRVEDDGIGFDDRFIDRIFAPFQRLHGRSSQYEGTGMGLAICKKIVERHGGSITARSVPGQGFTFIINLPIRQLGKGEE